MKIYTIGFTQKTAETFFNKLQGYGVQILIDIRLNNVSQLAGFSKGEDLKYFLKTICNCEYNHDLRFAPSKELLDAYKAKKTTWKEYEVIFNKILEKNKLYDAFCKEYGNYEKVCLLCSEPLPEKCHRRLVAEYLRKNNNDIKIIHI